MKIKKPSLFVWGILNFVLPLPLFVLSCFAAFSLVYGIGMKFHLLEIKFFLLLPFLPGFILFLAHFISSVLAIMKSAGQIKEWRAKLCAILSILGILQIIWMVINLSTADLHF